MELDLASAREARAFGFRGADSVPASKEPQDLAGQILHAVFTLEVHCWVGPGIFNLFPNGFNRGPYTLIFFERFQGPTQIETL